jgi:hypothetical protein
VIVRNRLAAWMLAVPLAFSYPVATRASNEADVANYVPWFLSSDVPVIKGPKCLEVPRACTFRPINRLIGQ